MAVHSHYENLKVARNAPPAVIKAAYRALSQAYHPDKNPDNPDAQRIMQLVNEAMRVLSDPQSRAAHDAWIQAQEAAHAAEAARRQAQATAAAAASAAAAATARARAEPPPSARPAAPSPPPAPAKPPAPRSSPLRGWLLILGLLATLAWGILDQPKRSPSVAMAKASTPRDAAPASPPRATHQAVDRGRVNTVQLNVRTGPGTAHDVVARLNLLDEVSVLRGQGTGWLMVRHATGTGYVSEAFIDIGSPQATLGALCPSVAPPSGTVFSMRPAPSSRNALTIEAPPGHHVWVKLKDVAGRTAFSGFVQQGRRYTFKGISDGTYQAWFLMGPNFSAQCQRFVEEPAASYDESFQDYRTREDQYSVYASHMEYSLRLQTQGNFRTTSGTTAQFMQD